jgi:hypothetical protein
MRGPYRLSTISRGLRTAMTPRIARLEAELAELRAEYAAVLLENEQLRGCNRELCLELAWREAL